MADQAIDQAELARRLGSSAQSVGQWMSGKAVARKQTTLLAKLQGGPQPEPQSTDSAPAAKKLKRESRQRQPRPAAAPSAPATTAAAAAASTSDASSTGHKPKPGKPRIKKEKRSALLAAAAASDRRKHDRAKAVTMAVKPGAAPAEIEEEDILLAILDGEDPPVV